MAFLAAQRLGCSHNTILAWIRRSALVDTVVKEERGRFVDVSELKLYEAVHNREPWAVALVLRTLGKDRGYGESVDVNLNAKVIMLPAKARTTGEWEELHHEHRHAATQNGT